MGMQMLHPYKTGIVAAIRLMVQCLVLVLLLPTSPLMS